MTEPTFTIKKEQETATFGRFILEPLEQGYGSTLGNSMRRMLLTSLQGAAVTKVRIDGVKHVFSTMPGLKEDIIELLLNIKKLRFTVPAGKSAKAKISLKGPAKITAADLEVDGGEVFNKDLYLGELTSSKAKLVAELFIETGYGYVTADEYEGEKELGDMVVDSLFTPVVRVNYKVEETRVGRMTNLDKLILEITTDGSIAPFAALQEAAKKLVSLFLHVYEPKSAVATESVAITPAVSDEVLKITLEELDLPTRIVNALRNGGIETIGQLLGTPKKRLFKIKNLGAKSVYSIEDILKAKGISLNV